ncbi:hypothetical protein [Psychroflexus planctonicus]|uniref:Uncharacterized protein n=1 Tax=Psychroflexus planctonicus TaxID=1526575 RepID=A0ABQ1SGE9_9FLAO|nr:hypothetical protein [Psychroflexus planctonicus]GGE30951.1 hypothetical protein GCM10010832_09260 [Psychroflexus planctonicus]
MKSRLYVFIGFIILFLSCNDIKQTEEKVETKKVDYPSYDLISENESITVESFDSTVVDINKYNHNNIVYKVGAEFVYEYQHITKENKIQYFKKAPNDSRIWHFVDSDSIDTSTIKTVKISVADGNPMSNHIPDYNQTCVKYSFDDEITNSMSGVIENEANVWIHPPRSNYFKILELNPFPYIKAPYEIGNEWDWSLQIGDSWADARWKMWEGSIENKCKYEIIDKIKLETKLGEFACYVIKSTAKSRIGQTELTAFFNEKFGFVKLNYTNIDGTKTNLELIEKRQYL